MKNKKEQSVPSPRPVRAGPKGAESRYIPMESYLTKGKLSYIIPKKSKNSAVAFFDLGRKEPLVYDLKKWFSLTRPGALPVPLASLSCNGWNQGPKGTEVRSLSPQEKARTYLPWNQLESRLSEALNSSTSRAPKVPSLREVSHLRENKEPVPSASSGIPCAGGRLELPFLFTSSLSPSGGKIGRLPRVAADHPKEAEGASLPCNINWTNWINKLPGNEVHASHTFGVRSPKNVVYLPPSACTGSKEKGMLIMPHQNQQISNWLNSWKWLSYQLQSNQLISGRIGTSLKRAGLCIWLGGITSFLPYREYSLRHQMLPSLEGQLKSFQIISLNPSNLNCVLTRDKAVQSILYRSRRVSGFSSLKRQEERRRSVVQITRSKSQKEERTEGTRSAGKFFIKRDPTSLA